MRHDGRTYRAYLLRLWKVGGTGQTDEWRASLEAPHTREVLAFTTLDRLFAFLADQIGQGDEETHPAQKSPF